MSLSTPAPPATEPVKRARGEATGREFILLVTALMATTALGIDLMLPAFPEIREQFGMAPDSTQVAWISCSCGELASTMAFENMSENIVEISDRVWKAVMPDEVVEQKDAIDLTDGARTPTA